MSKYDFELDLGENTSTGMILNRIKKGSTVLEFGCATGRMTRYMKEVLGCRVYIVEYDQGAFEQAAQFAEDGICDDIMKFCWAERFAGVSFDAIIFADVLEHLPQPEQVLSQAAAFLKDDGCIFVSVPNVTHNDVILKMFEERFDYTRTGLLDDTHVHFWGLENIKHLGQEAGLSVRSVEGTTCAAGNTEQNVQLGKNYLLENMLRQRQAGEVYQFVVMLDKKAGEEPVCALGASALHSHIYLNTGKGFNAQERVEIVSPYAGEGTYVVHYHMEDVKNLRQVRLDPVEYQGVILRRISICQNGRELPLVTTNGVWTEHGLYLPGDDPMVMAQVDPAQGEVTVDAAFMVPGAEYLNVLESMFDANKVRMEQELQDRDREIQDLRHSVAELNKQLLARDLTISMAESQVRQLQTDVGAYISLVNQKEKRLIAMERDLCPVKAELDRYTWLVGNATWILKILACYRKLRSFAGRVLRKAKRCAKKILGRTN